MSEHAVKAGKAAWIEAAYLQLLKIGPDGVSVDGLVKKLGVTKGSFYWHFRSRADLLAVALDRWEAEQTQALITAAEERHDPQDKLRLLFHRVAADATARLGENAIYASAAAGDAQVRRVVTRVSSSRLEYLTQLYVAIGFDAADAHGRARIALAVAMGERQLALAAPNLGMSSGDRSNLTDMVIELLNWPPTAGE